MSLSSIGSTTSLAASPFVFPSANAKIPAGTDDPSTGATSGASRFASAIDNAFASIGISLDGTSSTSTSATAAIGTADATTTDDTGESDALGAFLQSLLAALHGQSAGSAPPADDASSDPSQSQSVDPSSNANGAPRADGVAHAHHGHGGKLEADLQSLISELQSSSASTGTDADTATATGTATGSATSGDTALATLEKQFDALVATTGTSSTDSSGSLSTFLQSLAANLHGAPPTGNIVSTQA